MLRFAKVVGGILAAIGLWTVVSGAMFMAGGISARQTPGRMETAEAAGRLAADVQRRVCARWRFRAPQKP